MVKMYAPWCGHCKALAPIYSAVSDEIDDVVFGELDCTANQATCGRYGVRGYPTVKYFADKRMYSFDKERTEEGIKSYLVTMNGPLLVESTLDELMAKYDNGSAFVVMGTDQTKDQYSRFLTKYKGDLNLYFVYGEQMGLFAVQHGLLIKYQGKNEQYYIDGFVKMHRANFYPSIGEMSSAMEYGRICAAVLSEEGDAKLAKILTDVQKGSQQSTKYRQITEMPVVKGDVAQQAKFFELFDDNTTYEQYVIALHEAGSNYMYAKKQVSGADDVLTACRKLRDVDLAYGESKEDREKRLAKEKEEAEKRAEQEPD